MPGRRRHPAVPRCRGHGDRHRGRGRHATRRSPAVRKLVRRSVDTPARPAVSVCRRRAGGLNRSP
ncbi:Uncharacterised protein [Amycolatopsis camponoti]|uniref:Uncharacterized protein n=1 Tax=Amycolatopsis camponoti TaxID=2606593 RepID=A0A6I8LK93_9PSEU|nr:Uncharacterised protein [Amycolatopsis camponoti]